MEENIDNNVDKNKAVDFSDHKVLTVEEHKAPGVYYVVKLHRNPSGYLYYYIHVARLKSDRTWYNNSFCINYNDYSIISALLRKVSLFASTLPVSLVI
jgi:hypothetical protein